MNEELRLFPIEPNDSQEPTSGFIPTNPDEYAARVAEGARGPQKDREPSEAAKDQGWGGEVPKRPEEIQDAGDEGRLFIYPADGTPSVLPDPKAHAAMDPETKENYRKGIYNAREALRGGKTDIPE